MATINISTKLSSSDPRAKEVSCTLEIENRNSAAIQLLSVEPCVPKDVRIQHILDTTLADRRREYAQLCLELTRIYNTYLLTASEEFRSKRIQVEREVIKEVFLGQGMTKVVISALGEVMTHQQTRFIADAFSKYDTWKIKIRSAKDGKDLLPTIKDDYVRSVFEYKLSQTEELEAALAEQTDTLCTIEPGSTFSRTYVFDCRRNVLTTSSYTVNFDVAVRETADGKPINFAPSQSIEITPIPFAVTIMAVLFALLGVTLRHAIDPNADGQADFLGQLPGLLVSAKGVAAMTSAAIFYNVYESSELGKNIKMAVGWRSALLIGSLCGLFNKQIVAALGAFIGTAS